jgi:hypothetical protein
VFQVARRVDRTLHKTAEVTLDRAPAPAPGRHVLPETQTAGYIGEPDYYTRAVDSALRELEAIRSTVLPSYVAIRRKQDLTPLAKQIELAKSAMQVRHMILCANAHVHALEKAATHKDPMVLWLRARIDHVVARATKLGVYADAMEMRPQRFVDDTKMKSPSVTQKSDGKITHQPPPVTESTLASTKPAAIRKPANTPPPASPRQRLARGTARVATLSKPPWSSLRPGSRGSQL